MKRIVIRYLIPLCIVIVISIAAFLFFYKSPAVRTVDMFLKELIVHPSTDNQSLIIDKLKQHPFIKLLAKNKLFDGYRIISQERISDAVVKVKVQMHHKQGSVKVPFTVGKFKNKWFIVEFPKLTEIPAAIPINFEKAEENIHYTIDVEGTHIFSILPSATADIDIGAPVSLMLLEDYIIDHQPLLPIQLSKVMAVSDHQIEDAKLGNIPVSSNLIVYEKRDNKLVHLKDYHMPVGMKNVTLFQPKSQPGLIAYVNHSNLSMETIRVVLHDTGYKSRKHKEIVITCDQSFSVKNYIQPVELTFNKKDKVVFKAESDGVTVFHNGSKLTSSPHRWYVRSSDGSPLNIVNIKRSYSRGAYGTPYRGTIEIFPYQDGIGVVNEVGLEEYLYSVVPSEMPIRFGLEALKVQAIAARSYAVRSFLNTGFAPLGAHVDDSTASQVYNNIAEQPVAIQAVEDTRGLVPVVKNQVVDARFFSTSCGYTANFHEVWSDREHRFPSKEVPYLIAKPQFPGDVPSLYNEENFCAFIKEWDIDGYDRFSPFFRWALVMNRQQLEATINKNLSLAQKKEPHFILTRGTDGKFYESQVPEDIGELQNIEVIRRGEGGNIMELELTTTRGVFKIIKELNIRRVLQPVNHLSNGKPIEIECHDGTVYKNFPILPSAFACFDVTRDSSGDLTYITIIGGGYGHGVGMSQYGTYGLSLLGKSYKEIIEHFYPGSELKDIYSASFSTAFPLYQ